MVAAMLVASIAYVNRSGSAANQLTSDQLQPGDCLTGSNMDLPGSGSWPAYVTLVACTKPHVAEVFFASDIWPQSLTYPGKDPVIAQVDARCDDEFATYDGIDQAQSQFTYSTISPYDSSGWASGSRRVVCIAYVPSPSGPSGGAVMSYSLRGSKRLPGTRLSPGRRSVIQVTGLRSGSRAYPFCGAIFFGKFRPFLERTFLEGAAPR
jgi:hypothetical protein